LREILLSSSSIRIIGGSTNMLEQHHKYDKPFYQFFKIIKLRGFNESEAHTFLRAIAKENQKEQIETLIRTNPARIETLRRLTGGVPRTLVMLFDILMDDGGNAFDDLLKILDEVTPLYKHRMDDLPPQLQEIVHTIAMNWDGMLTREVAKKTKLESKAISAQLKQLEKYEIVESESIGKNKIYKIKERFFNIWYLMRYGRKKERQRVEWLVKFLVSWYSKEELEERAKQLIESLKTTEVSSNHAYHMAEALSHTGISVEKEHELKMSVSEYLVMIHSDLSNELTQSDFSLAEEAIHFILEDKLDEGYQTFLQITTVQRRIDAMSMLLYYVAILPLVEEDFEKSYTGFLAWLTFGKKEYALMIPIYIYLIWLIAKGQYYQAKKFFEMEEYRFKDIYKPIWYALMHLMGEDEEYKKMGSELIESVEDVLEDIREYAESDEDL
jgi:hypothetical protein